MTDESQKVYALHSQGKNYFNAGFFAEAELYFRAAVGAVNDHHDHLPEFKLVLSHLECSYREATYSAAPCKPSTFQTWFDFTVD